MRSVSSRPATGRGFSITEAVVVMALLALLLLIAGEIFVEMFARQEGLGAQLRGTTGFAPYDSIFVRDVRETSGFETEWKKITTNAPTSVVMRLPDTEAGKARRVAWVFANGTATRTEWVEEDVLATRVFTSDWWLEWELRGGSQLRLVGYVPPKPPETQPNRKEPKRLVRVATVRNL